MKRPTKKFNLMAGFSLVEVVVVMGIASVASLAVMQIQSSMNKGNARSMGQLERNQFTNLLSITHALPDKCEESLTGSIIGKSATSSTLDVTSIKIGSQTLTTGTQYGGLSFKSGEIAIEDFTVGDTLATANLNVKLEETIAGQKSEKEVSLPLALTVESDGTISGCSSGSSGSDPYYICSTLFNGTFDGENCKGPTIEGDSDNPVSVKVDSMDSYQMEVGDYLYTMDEDCQDTDSGDEDSGSTSYNGAMYSLVDRETCTITWYRTKISLNLVNIGAYQVADESADPDPTPTSDSGGGGGGKIDDGPVDVSTPALDFDEEALDDTDAKEFMAP